MSELELFRRLRQRGEQPAIVSQERTYSYNQLLSQIEEYRCQVRDCLATAPAGSTIAIRGDYAFERIAMFLAVIAEHRVAVLLPTAASNLAQKCSITHSHWLFDPAQSDTLQPTGIAATESHTLLRSLADNQQAGFVVFSSGSTAEPKAALHDFEKFSSHILTANKSKRTLGFLLLDHIAGVDTLLYTLYAGGCLVIPSSRSVPDVLQTIEQCQVQVLPASPSFLRLLSLMPINLERDLSSLEIITYGSEPIVASTLEKIRALFPEVQLIQKYGTTEFGSPRTRTRAGDGTWIRLDSESMTTRIENGILWVKTNSAMLGYLNAAQPERRDGWICTGDRVISDGHWYRILGRDSELINVGGEKVFPSEVEAVIEELDWIETAVVSGESHSILGQIVTATVRLIGEETEQVKKLIRNHCRSRLEPYKVPVKVKVARQPLRNVRHKKVRSLDA